MSREVFIIDAIKYVLPLDCFFIFDVVIYEVRTHLIYYIFQLN